MKTSSALNCQLNCYCMNTLPPSPWLSNNSFFLKMPSLLYEKNNKKVPYCMNDHGFATIQIWTKVTRSAFRCVPRFKANDDDVLKSSCTQNITTKPGLSKQTLSHHTLCYSSSAVGIATTLQAGRNAFRNPAGAREGTEAHQASYSMRTRVLSRGQS